MLMALLSITGCKSPSQPSALQQFQEDFERVPNYKNVIHVYGDRDNIYRAVWCEPIKEENVQICHRWLFLGKPVKREVIDKVCPISRDIVPPYCRDAEITYGKRS